MSAAQQAKRKRRQFKNRFAHLARLCGKNVRGGRPIYSGQSNLSVHEAIARERQIAARIAASKTKKN